MKLFKSFKSVKTTIIAVSLVLSSPLAIADTHFLIPGGPGGGWDTTARGIGEGLVKSGIEGNASLSKFTF